MAFKLKAPFLNTPPKGTKGMGTVLPEVEVTYMKSLEDDGWTDKTKSGHIGNDTYKPEGDDQDFVRVKSGVNMGTPLHNNPLDAGKSNVDFTSTLGQQESIEINDVNADGVENTETESEEPSAIDNFISDNDETEGVVQNQFLKERIGKARNERQKARLEGKLERREDRQERAADRIRSKQEERMNNPAKAARRLVRDKIRDERSEERTNRREQRAQTKIQNNLGKNAANEFMQQRLEDKVGKDVTSQMANDPDLMAEDDNVIIEDITMDSPQQYKPNRAGRSKQSGVLMTSPVLKSHKQSHKGAVGMMKMQSIAQDLGPVNMNAGFEALPDDVQDKILKNDK